MESAGNRRVQRVHLAQPLVARLGVAQVVLVDISILGARVEHHIPLAAGSRTRLSFEWDGREISSECRIVRSRLERLSSGPDGLTVYHSGLEFENVSAETDLLIKEMIGSYIARALAEQKLNARGALPAHDLSRMPIFRFGGQLTANPKDKAPLGAGLLPAARVARETGYVCYALEDHQWRRRKTSDPGQPDEGFTIAANEDHTQAELLCEAYLRSDAEGRRMIQLFAQLSIMEGEGLAARFKQ